MDIEIPDQTDKYNFSTKISYTNTNNNNSNNNNLIITNKNDENNFINIFPKNKKAIYALNQPLIKKNKNSISGGLTLCEGRLLNDLAEFKRSKIVGKIWIGCKRNLRKSKSFSIKKSKEKGLGFFPILFS